MNVTKVSFYKEKFFGPVVSNLGNSFIGIYGDSDRLHFFMTPYQIVPGGIYGISTI